MAAASSDGSGLRAWWTLVGGVAIASSVLTTFSILGVQRLHRKQKRLDLKEDIRRATKGRRSGEKQDREETLDTGCNVGNGNVPEADTAVPKYLAALTASQKGIPSQSTSPRPNASSRPSTTAALSEPFSPMDPRPSCSSLQSVSVLDLLLLPPPCC